MTGPADPTPTLRACVTCDIDPDANRPVAGRADAVSPGGRATWDGCATGLRHVAETLARFALPCTLFWEGRALRFVARHDPGLLTRLTDDPRCEHACHGMAHEDFAGTVSGRPLDSVRTTAALRQAGSTFEEVLGARPAGFRAPYCRLTPQLVAALDSEGFSYDASLTREPSSGQGLEPCELAGTHVMEAPLCRTRDSRGRAISSYLWQMFEGNREPDDYVLAVRALKAAGVRGLWQLAFHPWHLAVGADGRPLPPGRRDLLAAVIAGLRRIEGLIFTTVGAHVRGPAARGAAEQSRGR
jgi:peptidoglycan/xylan/chitin deacetylase (PgdA/CDA1 family)